MMRGVYVGHHERTGAAIFLTPEGVQRGTRIARMLEQDPWDTSLVRLVMLSHGSCNLIDQCCGSQLCVRLMQNKVFRRCAGPSSRRADRRRYLMKREIAGYGYLDDCLGCAQLAVCMRNASVLHDDRCRGRVGELMAGR